MLFSLSSSFICHKNNSVLYEFSFFTRGFVCPGNCFFLSCKVVKLKRCEQIVSVCAAIRLWRCSTKHLQCLIDVTHWCIGIVRNINEPIIIMEKSRTTEKTIMMKKRWKKKENDFCVTHFENKKTWFLLWRTKTPRSVSRVADTLCQQRTANWTWQ